MVFVESKQDWFQSLRFENDGEKLVIQGPKKPRKVVCEEETLIVPSAYAIPRKRTSVVCHGLKREQAHLNGKIGEVRVCYTSGRREIHFEESGLEPAS
mmetsp:Transcript_25642/g.37277  ORF Transcript_25642/g.37277 Transcript_25642/m.37277 type:complete len:98 (+) Transcript_25642:2369-2662(+)